MRIFSIFIFIFSSKAFAYPEFIGYGYASCLTCHFNGMGSGPLNDYGRALFSAEIASRQFYPAKMSDEDIAAQSGILGSVEMPVWLRPHLKYREVNLKRKYQSDAQISKYYRMQQDVGFSLMTEDQNYVGVFTWGNVIASGENKQRLLLREGYLRWQPVPSWWVYLGLHERVFGLRNIDHESFQRRPLGFRQTRNETAGHANSAGITVQKINDEWEFALSGFTGNPNDEKEFRHNGFSAQSEFQVGEKKRLGASYISGKSELNKKMAYAVHYRQGIGSGSALLAEYGIVQDENAGSPQTRGSYQLIQNLLHLTRGYNVKTTVERYNRDFKPSEPDYWKWSTGFLVFPAPRFELRLEVINLRSFSTGAVNDDDWTLQGQVHVSL